MSDPLELILKYEMTKMEAKAYKIALMWQDYSEKTFPGYRHTRLRKTGDPRRSILFKHCYKLVKTTQGIIQDNEYRLYIQAQLDVLKTRTDGTIHALIDPACLIGDAAWNRWKKWKRAYDRKMLEKEGTDTINEMANSSVIKRELEKTREFICSKLGNQYKMEDIHRTVSDKIFHKWLSLGKVSPFYAAVSPFISNEEFNIDLSVYRQLITQDIKEYFHKIYPNES